MSDKKTNTPNKKRKHRALRFIKNFVIFCVVFFIAIPYWLLPLGVNYVVKNKLNDLGFVNPQVSTQHITLFSTKITEIKAETENGIKIECPLIEISYSPISLINKEIYSIHIAESSIGISDLLPQTLKEKLHSDNISLQLNIENIDNHYIGTLNGDLLGGSYSSDFSMNIDNGELIIDGAINPVLKDDFPVPTVVVNYKLNNCFSAQPIGSGELSILETNLKLTSSFCLTNNIVDFSITLNSVVSKEDPYLERLFARIDKNQQILSLYSEVYSKLAVKLPTGSTTPSWDFVFRINNVNSTLKIAEDKELKIGNASASIHLSGLSNKWVLHSMPIYIGNINLEPFHFTNGIFKIVADDHEFLLSEGHINALGGTLNVYALYLNFSQLNAGFTIFVDNIQINELISVLPNIEGTGTGSLHGKLPISVFRGKQLKIHNAYLFSKPGVGGKLKLSNTTPLQETLRASGIPEQTCTDLGIALTDLDYSVIRLEFIEDSYQNQHIQFQLEGSHNLKNKDVPITLNANIQGGIEDVLNLGLKTQGILK